MRTLMLFLLLACAFNIAHAEEFNAKAIAVLDGDTVLVLRGSQKVKVRLVNIDAPEKAQEYGMASRQSLVGMVLRKQVQVSSQAMDEYGRMIAHFSVDGLNVNEEQVRRGMAWAAAGWRQSRRAAPRPPEGRVSGGVPFTGAPTGVPLAGDYSHFASSAASSQPPRDPLHSDRHYIALQHEAQQARRGLWAQSSPMPPWQWRKLHAADAPPQRAPGAQGYTCGSKRHCSQMSSCNEAHFYLTHCGVKSLDRDGDGVPCEKLCAPVARQGRNY